MADKIKVRGVVTSPYARPGQVAEVENQPGVQYYLSTGVLEAVDNDVDNAPPAQQPAKPAVVKVNAISAKPDDQEGNSDGEGDGQD